MNVVVDRRFTWRYTSSMNIAEETVALLGGQASVAAALGIDRAAVCRWVRKGVVPWVRIPEIMQLAEEKGVSGVDAEALEDAARNRLTSLREAARSKRAA